MLLAIEFLMLGLGVAVLAAGSHGPLLVGLAWFSVSFLFVGIAYAGLPQLVFVKHRDSGRIGWYCKVLLWPYLMLTWGIWHLIRMFERGPPFVQVVPGIYIGRRLLLEEYPPDLRTVVDLTLEFDEVKPATPRLQYEHIPILDGVALSPAELQRVAERISSALRPLYLHCALGRGRTSMVAAAVLLTMGVARSPEAALDLVASARPGARPNGAQRASVTALRFRATSLPTCGPPPG
jgi:hypothetical protein